MELVFGAMFGLFTLFFWLQGGPFARVLMFLILSVVLGFGSVLITGNAADYNNFAGIGVAILIAWLLSGLPIYIKRNRVQLIEEFSKPLPNGWHIVPSWRRSPDPLVPLSRQNGRRL